MLQAQKKQPDLNKTCLSGEPTGEGFRGQKLLRLSGNFHDRKTCQARSAFLGGCADTGHVTAYDSSYYYPTGSYVRDYAGYTQSYPYSDSSNGPRYRIIAGQHVYEPYYYGSYYSY